MPQLLLLHVMNEDPVVVETDRLPEATDTCVVGMHPRRKDNKEVHYILPDVTTVIFPMNRINFIEVLPSGEDEEVFKPFRE
ncbi:MAG TPA: hypothetical protein VKQ72_06965 [Aggregatilineales bacterium]|nr:hypothetical protein [Aggregatilineales bacterium]